MSSAVVRFTFPVAAAASILLAGTVAGAEDFYAGKTISIVVGSAPGGAYDAMARLVGRRLSQYIPGNPTIIFKNMPGAASRIAAVYVYNAAAKDGLTIGAVAPQALLGDVSQLKYDPLRFDLVGSAAAVSYVCVVRPDAPAKSFEETQGKEIIMGTSAPGSAGYEATMILKRVLGAQFRLITGYPNSVATSMAVEKGEIHGACGGMDQVSPNRDMQNKISALVQINVEPNVRLTAMGAPPIWKFVKNEEDRKLLKYLLASQAIGRPYMMPPDSPPEAVAIIRKAFDLAVADPGFIEDTTRAVLEVAPISAAKMREVMTESYGASPELVERARQVLQ